jgi:endonuclease VIII
LRGMPEGPSIVILREELSAFTGKRILGVFGNAKADLPRLRNKKILSLKSWGKHFLVCFNGFYLRVHFLLFGSYRINERRDISPRLSIRTRAGELNLYNCSVKIVEGSPDEVYDWEADVMSERWDEKKALKKFRLKKEERVCDLLLDQQLFSGSGNIIKNEVLFRTRVHPMSLAGKMPLAKAKAVVKDVGDYSWRFYEWKKQFVLRRNWQVYKQKECPRCGIGLVRNYLGKTNRLTFSCAGCQVVYD